MASRRGTGANGRVAAPLQAGGDSPIKVLRRDAWDLSTVPVCSGLVIQSKLSAYTKRLRFSQIVVRRGLRR
jgi:hypothetical protein